MDATYNLVDEPFVPCLMQDGTLTELGLLPALTRAHEVRELAHSSPLVTCALYRLLLAVLHRLFGPTTEDDWRSLWEDGHFEHQRIGDYFGQWHHRFDLFDPDRPFYQVPGLDLNRVTPVSKLAQEMASGNNSTLFDHTTVANPPALTYAEAAQLLLAMQSYAVGLGRSATGHRKDSPRCREIRAMMVGNSLFETLLLNLSQYPGRFPTIDKSEDLPAWEREVPREPGTEDVCSGLVDYLTWQSRAIRLLPDEGHVEWVYLAQGVEMTDPPLDPMGCYTRNTQGEQKGIVVFEERALWRDSYALFRLANSEWKPPDSAEWAARLVRKGVLDFGRSCHFLVIGLAFNRDRRAKIDLWRQDTLPLSDEYLRDEERVQLLKRAIELAESTGQALRAAARTFADVACGGESNNGGQPNREKLRDAREALADALALGRRLWPELEGPFRQLMLRLGSHQANPDRALWEWCEGLRRTAVSAFESGVEELERSPRLMRAGAMAERKLRMALAFLPTTNERRSEDEQDIG
ncbi:MAG: type I-E CRISPR-associated protein Cse1/CasA [Candidatus Brocadiia bacterium]